MHDMNKNIFKDLSLDDLLEYSQSMNPLIFGESVATIGLIISIYSLFRDICREGLYVWHRMNLGDMI